VIACGIISNLIDNIFIEEKRSTSAK